MAYKNLLKPSINWFLIFIPITLILERMIPEKPVYIFLSAALAIIPIASLIVKSTEKIAVRTGDAIGGLLNATFGNAPELIIAFVALRSGFTDMVRASIVGAILANLLLGLGLAYFLGGLRYHIQEFNPRAAGMQASMMMIAVISMLVPGSYHILVTDEAIRYEQYLNVGIAVVLLVSYALSLFFMIRTHPDFFASEQHNQSEHEYQWGIGKAVALLIFSSVLAAWMSEILVGAVEGASEDLGVSKTFIGLVVLAVVGGAAELGSAVMMGRKNRMDLAIGIALGSSVQIALFVAPLLVLLSLFAAPVPFVLAFSRGEIVLVFMTLLITAFVGSGGKTNWFKGVQLLTVYIIFAILFFLIPGK
jgi:Ca2+:H+ antiporter